ncbi:MAG: KpsF/GutQ family sugar-phosphate isomerase [Gemmatimonadota bacterium]|nr:KpsF/GutQ family sugar-phosphate isomerase [Gemmatimonadota bacterium]
MSTVANAAAERMAGSAANPGSPAAAGRAPPSARDEALVAEGRRVLALEAKAVGALAGRLDERFARAVDLVFACRGRVVASGIGKSGLIARKVAATLTSTGTPAVFLHPVDGLHGDLGIVGADDMMILVSKSGSTRELEGLLAFAERHDVPVVALVGDPGSPLGRRAAAALDCGVRAEACPLELAPTSSSTAALAMGDALAMALLRRRGFERGDFARIHPAGSLGRRLTLRVRDVMESDGYPAVPPHCSAREIIEPLARMRGTVPVIGRDRSVLGVVTAGDLTRFMQRTEDFLDVPVSEFMTRAPRIASPEDPGAAAVRRMEEHGIMALPVVSEGALVGIVHLHDLLRSGAA